MAWRCPSRCKGGVNGVLCAMPQRQAIGNDCESLSVEHIDPFQIHVTEKSVCPHCRPCFSVHLCCCLLECKPSSPSKDAQHGLRGSGVRGTRSTRRFWMISKPLRPESTVRVIVVLLCVVVLLLCCCCCCCGGGGGVLLWWCVVVVVCLLGLDVGSGNKLFSAKLTWNKRLCRKSDRGWGVTVHGN